MSRKLFGTDHDLFRSSVREFVEREVAPNIDEWEAAGIVDKEMFRKAGSAPSEFKSQRFSLFDTALSTSISSINMPLMLNIRILLCAGI